MKISRILIVFFMALALISSSCKDKLFDFNLQNIESDGEWGIPIMNKTIHANDLIQNLDSLVFFNNDGTLTFVLEKEVKNIVSIQNLFKIRDQIIDTTNTVNISHLPNFDITQAIQFNVNTDDFIIRYANIKSGSLNISFNINYATFEYSAVLTTDNIRTAQEEPLTLQFSNTQHTNSINFNNYIFEPDEEGHVIFTAHIVVPTSLSLNEIQYSSHVELTDFAIRSVKGRVTSLSKHIEAKTAFNFNLNEIIFNDMLFNNAKVSLFCQNSICRIDGSLNDVHLFGNDGAYASLINHPVNFSSPTSNQYVFVAEANMPTIAYTPNYDTLGLNCDFNVNPLGFNAGDITVDENSSFSMKFKTEMPANISINNAVYNDTIDNSLYGQLNMDNLQSIEGLTLRIAISNAFPFDLIPTIDFLNSSSGSTYRLNLNNMRVHGGYNGVPYQHSPIFIELQRDDAQEISHADKIIMNFKLDTQGYDVEVKDSQYIRAAIGAKIKYSNINL